MSTEFQFVHITKNEFHQRTEHKIQRVIFSCLQIYLFPCPPSPAARIASFETQRVPHPYKEPRERESHAVRHTGGKVRQRHLLWQARGYLQGEARQPEWARLGRARLFERGRARVSHREAFSVYRPASAQKTHRRGENAIRSGTLVRPRFRSPANRSRIARCNPVPILLADNRISARAPSDFLCQLGSCPDRRISGDAEAPEETARFFGMFFSRRFLWGMQALGDGAFSAFSAFRKI